MTDKLQTYRAYHRFVRRLLALGGIWPCTKDWHVLYRQLPILTGCACSFALYGMLNFFREHVGNLQLFTKAVSLFMSILGTVLKSTIFFRHRDELAELEETLEALFEETLQQPELESPVLRALGNFCYPGYLATSLVCLSTSTLFLGPLIYLAVQWAKGVDPARYRYLLPLPGYFPGLTRRPGLFYEVAYLVQTHAMWNLFFVTTAVDTFFGLCVFRMCGVLRAQSCEIGRALRERDYGDSFRRCVERHNRLLHCRRVLEGAYGFIVLYLALTNAVIMCALIYQASQMESVTVGSVVLFVTYMGVKLSQTILYAWHGTILTTESETFRQSIYNSSWCDYGNKSIGINVVIALMQRPIVITACSFFSITMDFFVSIVNTTVSYFFLLRTMEEKT